MHDVSVKRPVKGRAWNGGVFRNFWRHSGISWKVMWRSNIEFAIWTFIFLWSNLTGKMSDKKPQVKRIAKKRCCSSFLWRNGGIPSRIESVRVSWKQHQNPWQNIIRSNMVAPMEVKLSGRIFGQQCSKLECFLFFYSWFLVWVMTLQCWRRSKLKEHWNTGIPSLQKLGSKLVQGLHSSSITKDTLIWMMRMLVGELFATGCWMFLASSKLKTTSAEQSKCRQS